MPPLNAELYDALIAIKVPEEKARAAAQAIAESNNAQRTMWTDIKTDLRALNTRVTMLMWVVGIGFAIIGIMIAVLGITIT